MENRINQVVELENGKEYYILKQAVYGGDNYFVAAEVSEDGEDLKDKLKNLLSVKPEDLKDAAERIFQNSSNTKTTVISDKALKKYAKN